MNGFWLCAALVSMHTDPLESLGGDVTGGMNVYVRELARALPRQGVHVDVFTRDTGSGVPPVEEIAPGARLIRIPAGPKKPLDKFSQSLFTEEFAEGIREFAEAQGGEYDLFSTHYWLSALAVERLSKAWNVPLTHRFHTIAVQKNRSLPTPTGREPEARVLAETGIAKRADALFASSSAEANLLSESLGASGSCIHVIPCGVDFERFAPLPREAARAALGLREDDRVLLNVGRIEPIKGLDRLVSALALMKSKRPEVRPLVIHVGGAIRDSARDLAQNSNGNGLGPEDFSSPAQREEVRRITKLAAEAGVAENFRFMGARPQSDLPTFYSAADALAITSRYETFGLVALEAAACALPAVAFDTGGLSSAIENGGSGLLVPDGDNEAFADAALQILTSPELRARLGRRARDRAKTFTWAAIASKEIKVWKKLLEGRTEDQKRIRRPACAGAAA
jgi:D-inositol-3-phosphate glycosyltransferase